MPSPRTQPERRSAAGACCLTAISAGLRCYPNGGTRGSVLRCCATSWISRAPVDMRAILNSQTQAMPSLRALWIRRGRRRISGGGIPHRTMTRTL